MIGYLALNLSEMWQVKLCGVQRSNFSDRVVPGFDVQLRRNKRWDWRTKTDPHAGNIAAKDVIIPMINMMMTGVSGRRDRADLERRKSNDFAVLQPSDAICRHSRNAPPKFFHFIAKDAFSRIDQSRGVDQMRNPTRMHVNRGAQLSESPRCAGVVEMDVTKKHMAHVGWLEADLSQLVNNCLERRFGSNIEENKATIGFQCCDGDNIRPAEVASIEHVNLQRIRCFITGGDLAIGDAALRGTRTSAKE